MGITGEVFLESRLRIIDPGNPRSIASRVVILLIADAFEHDLLSAAANYEKIIQI